MIYQSQASRLHRINSSPVKINSRAFITNHQRQGTQATGGKAELDLRLPKASDRWRRHLRPRPVHSHAQRGAVDDRNHRFGQLFEGEKMNETTRAFENRFDDVLFDRRRR